MNANISAGAFNIFEESRSVSDEPKSDNMVREEKMSSKDKAPKVPNSVSGNSEIPLVDVQKCTGCGICVDVCRRGAISLVDHIALIDSALCINCRLCVRKCPNGALS